MWRTIGFLAFFGLWSVVALYASESSQRLILPVPDTSGIPRERLTLSIKIPPKVEVQDEIPPVRTRPRARAWDNYDFRPFRRVPEERFVFDTLRTFVSKGVLTDASSRITVSSPHLATETTVLTTLARLREKLLDIHAHGALRRFGLSVSDLENLQQVIELVSSRLGIVRLDQRTMNREIDDMISFLRKTTGKGQLRIIEVKEQRDGSTILELEIVKGE